MFIVKSYVVKPDKIITDHSAVKNNPSDFFIEICEINDKISASLDFDYLEGTIYIKYRKVILLDFIHCYFVADLWYSLLNLVENVIEKGEGVAYFPDQPSEIKLTRMTKDLVLYSLITNKTFKTTLPKYDFLIALLDGAEYFFKTLIRFNSNYKYALARVKELRSKLN
jgi:hypothetical protein